MTLETKSHEGCEPVLTLNRVTLGVSYREVVSAFYGKERQQVMKVFTNRREAWEPTRQRSPRMGQLGCPHPTPQPGGGAETTHIRFLAAWLWGPDVQDPGVGRVGFGRGLCLWLAGGSFSL